VGMRMAMRPTTDADRSGTTQVLDQTIKDAGYSKSQLEPMDRFQMGGSSVRQ
jgi:hypothetical protein